MNELFCELSATSSLLTFGYQWLRCMAVAQERERDYINPDDIINIGASLP